jgi:hypothetical protein
MKQVNYEIHYNEGNKLMTTLVPHIFMDYPPPLKNTGI